MLSLYSMVKQLLCMQFSNGEGNRETVLAILTQMLSGKYLVIWLNIEHSRIFFFFHIIVKRQTHNQVHINFSIHTFMAYRICTTF